VPAPVTLGLLGVGLIGLMVRARLGRLHHSL
jgi:biotin transporter BioY